MHIVAANESILCGYEYGANWIWKDRDVVNVGTGSKNVPYKLHATVTLGIFPDKNCKSIIMHGLEFGSWDVRIHATKM